MCEETAKASTHSQRVGVLPWVAQVQLFGGTLLALIRSLLSSLCIWRNQPSWSGEDGLKEAGLLSSSPLFCPFGTKWIRLWVSIVIEALLCGNLRGFSLSRNTGHPLWEPELPSPQSLFSAGQGEVPRISILLSVQVWVNSATLFVFAASVSLPLCPSHFSFPRPFLLLVAHPSSLRPCHCLFQVFPAGMGSLLWSPG